MGAFLSAHYHALDGVKVVILSPGTLTHSIQRPNRGSVLRERVPFSQWANPQHQCSPSLEYLISSIYILHICNQDKTSFQLQPKNLKIPILDFHSPSDISGQFSGE